MCLPKKKLLFYLRRQKLNAVPYITKKKKIDTYLDKRILHNLVNYFFYFPFPASVFLWKVIPDCLKKVEKCSLLFQISLLQYIKNISDYFI